MRKRRRRRRRGGEEEKKNNPREADKILKIEKAPGMRIGTRRHTGVGVCE
jgi:hypothetical protein